MFVEDRAFSTDKITCPHCYSIDEDWHEYVDPTEMYAEFPLNCFDCGKPFHVVMETKVRFTTEPLEEEPYDTD
jgi:hypothetical protein